MIDLTWEDIGEHLDKGDLEEWLKEERAKDKARQLNEYADTPQTDLLVKTPQKSRDSHEVADAPQTDCSWR